MNYLKLPKLGILSLYSFLVFLGTVTLLFAQEGTPAGGAEGAPAQQPSIMGMLFPFILMFAVVYFLMIRPQQRRMKAQQDMLSKLQSGDEVITSSGILGTVAGMTDKVVTLEVARDVRIKILNSQVAQVVQGEIKDLAANQ